MSRVHEGSITSVPQEKQTPDLQREQILPCAQWANHKLPLVCFNNGQKGGSGFRKVKRLEGTMMHDLGVGSKQSRIG